MSSPKASNAEANGPPSRFANFLYDASLFLWKIVIYIFFREIRPRGAFHIPRDGPVIFVAAPHHNQASTISFSCSPCLLTHSYIAQFLDFHLALQIYRETGRRIRFLVAAKSMDRKVVGFFARLIQSSKFTYVLECYSLSIPFSPRCACRRLCIIRHWANCDCR